MSGRTEQPTPRRLREARRRGEVATSPELSGAAALAAGLTALWATAPGAAAALGRALAAALRSAGGDGAPDAAGVLLEGMGLVLRITLPVAGAALVAGGAAAALQTGLGVFPEALRPRLERLDPLRGLRRLASPAELGRAGLGLVKAAVLVALLLRWWRRAAPALAALPAAGGAALARALPSLGGLAATLAAAAIAFGLLDLALARRRHRRALRMTRDEIRRELREDEGDPSRRAERRRVHRALVEAGPVAQATVVVVNPTRIAIALRHERGGEEAPRVVAKGSGAAAARIRSAARRAGVPIVRDVALARALHRLADVGDELPEELYDAAAALLAHLYGAPEPA